MFVTFVVKHLSYATGWYDWHDWHDWHDVSVSFTKAFPVSLCSLLGSSEECQSPKTNCVRAVKKITLSSVTPISPPYPVFPDPLEFRPQSSASIPFLDCLGCFLAILEYDAKGIRRFVCFWFCFVFGSH